MERAVEKKARPGLLRAWMLTLVCPGLGQMALGARRRGGLTLVAVLGSLIWMLGAGYLAGTSVFQALIEQRGGALGREEIMALLADGTVAREIARAIAAPGLIFTAVFVYAFADSAWLVLRGRSTGSHGAS